MKLWHLETVQRISILEERDSLLGLSFSLLAGHSLRGFASMGIDNMNLYLPGVLPFFIMCAFGLLKGWTLQ